MYLGRQWWATEADGEARGRPWEVIGRACEVRGTAWEVRGRACEDRGRAWSPKAGHGSQSRTLEPRGRPRKPEPGLGRQKCAWEASSVQKRPDFCLFRRQTSRNKFLKKFSEPKGLLLRYQLANDATSSVYDYYLHRFLSVAWLMNHFSMFLIG